VRSGPESLNSLTELFSTVFDTRRATYPIGGKSHFSAFRWLPRHASNMSHQRVNGAFPST